MGSEMCIRDSVDIMRRVAVWLLRIPLSELRQILAVEELPKPTQISLGELLVGDDLNRMALHASTFYGSTILTPACWKSFTVRVAHTAPCARQIAAIWASVVLIGAPAASRDASISAYRSPRQHRMRAPTGSPDTALPLPRSRATARPCVGHPGAVGH